MEKHLKKLLHVLDRCKDIKTFEEKKLHVLGQRNNTPSQNMQKNLKSFCMFWVSGKKMEKHLKRLFWAGAKRCWASRLAQLAQLVKRHKLLQVFDFPV